jgi:hypothetical protein
MRFRVFETKAPDVTSSERTKNIKAKVIFSSMVGDAAICTDAPGGNYTGTIRFDVSGNVTNYRSYDLANVMGVGAALQWDNCCRGLGAFGPYVGGFNGEEGLETWNANGSEMTYPDNIRAMQYWAGPTGTPGASGWIVNSLNNSGATGTQGSTLDGSGVWIDPSNNLFGSIDDCKIDEWKQNILLADAYRHESGNNTKKNYMVGYQQVGGNKNHMNRWSLRAAGGSIPLCTCSPNAIFNLSLVHGNKEVTLTWTGPASGFYGIIEYEYDINLDGNWISTGNPPPSPLTFTVGGLDNGTLYTFRIRAVNAIGNGPASAPETATPSTIPDPPTGLTGIHGNQQVRLSWIPPVDDGGNTISSYQYDKVVTGATGWDGWTNASNGPSGVLGPFIVTPLTNGISYDFKVRAVNINGGGGDSNEITEIPATVPNAPTGLTGVYGDQLVTLSWTPSSDDGGNPIQYYEYYKGGGTGATGWLGSAGSSGPYTVQPLENGTPYDFKVRAVNDNGSGSDSNEITVTPSTLPNAPTGLTGVVGIEQVTLSWTPSSDDGGNPIQYYEYYKEGVTGATGWYSVGVSGPSGPFTVQSLDNGTPYNFKVRAVNGGGGGSGSNEITVTAPLAAIADMPANRGQSPAVAGYNNNLYVFGGKYWGGPTPPYSTYDTFVVYDTTTNSWSSPLPTMSVGRAWVYGTIWQDKAYIYSGTDDQTAASHQTMEIYDIPSNSFSIVATPDKRTNYAAGAINGKIYICGGYSVSIPGVANTIISYDTSTGNFETALTSMPTSLQQHAAAVYNNKLYVMGGSNAGGTTQDQLYVYDPAGSPGGTWTTLAIMPASRYSLSAVTLGSYIYAVGGSDGGLKNTVFRYDPALNVWATVNPMLTARASFGLGVANNAMYACGNSFGLSKTGERIL